AWSSTTAPMKMSATSSRPLLRILRLLRLSANLSQPSKSRGSMSVHSRHWRFLKTSRGRALDEATSPTVSAMTFLVGGPMATAGSLVKLLKMYLSSEEMSACAERNNQPAPREKLETAEREERKEARESVSDLSLWSKLI